MTSDPPLGGGPRTSKIYRQIQAAAGGMEGVDVEGAKEALELTAETVLEQARWLGR